VNPVPLRRRLGGWAGAWDVEGFNIGGHPSGFVVLYQDRQTEEMVPEWAGYDDDGRPRPFAARAFASAVAQSFLRDNRADYCEVVNSEGTVVETWTRRANRPARYDCKRLAYGLIS
jgi:hypothetical protein